MAVERVRDGERPSSVVASYGFNRTTIYRWLSAAATPGVGLRALRSRPATGRPRSLTPHQAHASVDTVILQSTKCRYITDWRVIAIDVTSDDRWRELVMRVLSHQPPDPLVVSDHPLLPQGGATRRQPYASISSQMAVIAATRAVSSSVALGEP